MKLTRGEFAREYRTDNFEAWGHFVKGRDLINRLTKEDFLKAREHFEQATELDPDYTAAWLFQALTHHLEVRMGVSDSPAESIRLKSRIPRIGHVFPKLD